MTKEILKSISDLLIEWQDAYLSGSNIPGHEQCAGEVRAKEYNAKVELLRDAINNYLDYQKAGSDSLFGNSHEYWELHWEHYTTA